jgi:hypothetical protein
LKANNRRLPAIGWPLLAQSGPSRNDGDGIIGFALKSGDFGIGVLPDEHARDFRIDQASSCFVVQNLATCREMDVFHPADKFGSFLLELRLEAGCGGFAQSVRLLGRGGQ